METYLQVLIAFLTFFTGYMAKSKLKCNSKCFCCDLEFIHNQSDNKLQGVKIIKKMKTNLSDESLN